MPKSAFVVTSRIVTGTVGIAVAAATIAAAALLPLPSIQFTPTALDVVPEPAPKQLVCPGSMLTLGDSGGQNASTAMPFGEVETSTVATDGTLSRESLATGGPGAPSIVTAPADTGSNIAGAQYESIVTNPDYFGLAVAPCARPSGDTWLVGGSTAVGRTTLINLMNPGDVDVTVDLALYSESGQVDAPGLTGIVVPTKGQRVLSLAGFAPGKQSLAVHVTSQGGGVSAVLQQSIIRGIEPSGLEIISPAAAPRTTAVIPGVHVVDSEAVEGRLGEEGFDDLIPALRVLVPAGAPAQATVRIIPVTAEAAGASFDLTLEPGLVADLPVEGLVDGTYAVIIEATEPVLAGMRVSTVAPAKQGTVKAGATDVAWFVASDALSDAVYASIPPLPSMLHLTNPTLALITVGIDGESVLIGPGAGVSLPVSGGRALELSGAKGLHASLSATEAGRIATFPLSAAAGAEPPVTVVAG